MKIYIVRHGETEWNKLGRWQGNEDIPLNSHGAEQAYKVSKEFIDKGIKKIFASPLVRAAATAEAIQKYTKTPIIYNDGLKEMYFGKWEGLTMEEILGNYNELFSDWEKEPKAEIGLGVENYHNLQSRAYKTLEDICKSEDDDIVIVTHGSWIRALMCKVLNIPLNNRRGFEIDNTSLSILNFDKKDNNFNVITLNSISHLS